MESHLTINPLQANLQDLTQAATNLQADLATVMGPALEAEPLDQQDLQAQIAALGPPPHNRAGEATKQAYADKVTTLIGNSTHALVVA